MQQQTIDTALVLGGSMAGLVAARVLADHATQVTIVERDTLPEGSHLRRGVPQARHAHALLGHGRQVLEALFPGFEQDLVEHGAVRGQARTYAGGGYHAQVVDLHGRLFVSRPLLEWYVRTRVQALPNVSIVEDTQVLSLVGDAARDRVVGARVRSRADGAAEHGIAADLVVDATGRGSRAPAWLEELGYPAAPEEEVPVDMGYSTRIYRREPEHLHGDLLVNVAPSPLLARASAMLALEDERWMVTIAGYFGDDPPTDDAGFLAFAHSLPAREIYDTIRSATLLEDSTTYRFRANEWRHYEWLTRFPKGLLIIGDALCSFTPIYGQGMTVAALEAVALGECLAEGTENLAYRFFSRAAKIIANPWSITVGNDRRLSRSAPQPSPPLRAISWYMARFHVAARHDVRLAAAFLRVANLFDPPAALLRPGIAARVLWGNLRLGIGRPSRSEQPEARSEPARA